MTKASVLIFALVVFFVSPVFAVNELTGKQLPSVVKAAIEAANKVSFSWDSKNDKTAIEQDQVVLIQNMPEFCKSRSISSTDCGKFGLAFVIDQAYPMYLNGDFTNTPSNYNQVERMYSGGATNIIYFTAGLLVHEDYHAQGHNDELNAYQRELAFMTVVKQNDSVNNAVWLSGYLDSIQANIAAYTNKQDDSLSVKTVAKNK